MYVGQFLIHSQLLAKMYRYMGCKIGRHCLIAGTILEYDLIELGDYCIVEQGALIQPHTYEGRVLKMENIQIGNNTWIGTNSLILPGAKLQNNVLIEPNTLIMRNDTIKDKTSWQGNPAKRIKANNTSDRRLTVLKYKKPSRRVMSATSPNTSAAPVKPL